MQIALQGIHTLGNHNTIELDGLLVRYQNYPLSDLLCKTYYST